MTAHVVNLPRVRLALCRLDAAVDRWPELRTQNARERARAWLAHPNALEVMNMAVEKQGLNLRLPAADLARADALVDLVGNDPATQWGRVTRAAVLRMAVAEGLAVLEARHRQTGSSPTATGPRPTR